MVGDPTLVHLSSDDFLLTFYKNSKNRPSIFKSAVATIEKNSVLAKIGNLEKADKENLAGFLQTLC